MLFLRHLFKFSSSGGSFNETFSSFLTLGGPFKATFSLRRAREKNKIRQYGRGHPAPQGRGHVRKVRENPLKVWVKTQKPRTGWLKGQKSCHGKIQAKLAKNFTKIYNRPKNIPTQSKRIPKRTRRKNIFIYCSWV